MKRQILTRFYIIILAVVVLPAQLAAAGFHRADVGDLIENIALPSLAGERLPLLGDATVNVFTFFKPDQEHSQTTLTHLAELEKEFAGKSVHWVAVVSDRFTPAAIEAAVEKSAIAMPVLIDTGDELYGRLGVALVPNIGITDSEHRLVADLPFNKVNYTTVIRGHIQHQLQEISDAELQNILNPPAATQGSNGEVAHRHLRYAERLFAAGLIDQALKNVQASLEKDPGQAAAYVLQGQILEAQGLVDEALKSYAKALELDPDNMEARSSRETLLEGRK